MPQLNPAPWLPALIMTWITIIVLFKLMMTLQPATEPTKNILLHPPTIWTWTWL
uniref:ATP synthase complex subunit 8 n=1 Tax=Gekko swinhonis TaxID=146912 RepID=K9JVQ5_9SAUR|nr:ATPase subunit 8 [Gekko swinhonis]